MTETPEFAAMLSRMLTAYGRRVADADPVDLATMLRLRDDLDASITHAVAGLRTRHSWSEIAAPLGITRQAAQMKWRNLG